MYLSIRNGLPGLWPAGKLLLFDDRVCDSSSSFPTTRASIDLILHSCMSHSPFVSPSLSLSIAGTLPFFPRFFFLFLARLLSSRHFLFHLLPSLWGERHGVGALANWLLEGKMCAGSSSETTTRRRRASDECSVWLPLVVVVFPAIFRSIPRV